ncbi:hypothetical protein GQ42DRAFT_176411 [Ramicandelaber brevisporus]|nr:hypothetical protein GQ42DRAFT_176411 [Ramicandelaber brevisporus]
MSSSSSWRYPQRKPTTGADQQQQQQQPASASSSDPTKSPFHKLFKQLADDNRSSSTPSSSTSASTSASASAKPELSKAATTATQNISSPQYTASHARSAASSASSAGAGGAPPIDIRNTAAYKRKLRSWTTIIVSLPFVIVGTEKSYRYLVLGEDQQQHTEMRRILTEQSLDQDQKPSYPPRPRSDNT